MTVLTISATVPLLRYKQWHASQGKETFYRVLENPESVGDFEPSTCDLTNQEFGSVALVAYQKKTGSWRMPDRGPVGSSKLQGTLLDEAGLRKRYPVPLLGYKQWHASKRFMEAEKLPALNEAEWLVSEDMNRMLAAAFPQQTEAALRKQRLFRCGCGRLIWHLLEDTRSRRAIEVAERVADGRIPAEALREAGMQAGRALDEYDTIDFEDDDSSAPQPSINDPVTCAMRVACCGASRNVEWSLSESFLCAYYAAHALGRAVGPSLLRDIVGNPFRKVQIEPAWRQGKDGAVRKLAQQLYDERQFQRLPELAQALEQAGCTQQALLSHCWQVHEQVRGCWVLDLILGFPAGLTAQPVPLLGYKQWHASNRCLSS